MAGISHIQDTIVAHQQVLEEIRSSSTYDYDRQISGRESHLLDDIFDAIEKIFNQSAMTLNNTPEWLWWILGIIALCVIIVLLYMNREAVIKRFMRNHKVKYTAEEDDINAIDFELEIAKALKAGNYRAACRYIYLKTLKALSDGKAIDWKIFKTPLQYTSEVRDREFRDITNHFLRVRYGDFEATGELYDEMLALHRVIVEKHPAVDDDEDNKDEKGGKRS